MIEAALARYLMTIPEVTNLVGNRIYRERRRADNKPTAPESGENAITIGRVSANRQYALEGEINAAPVTLRIDCWAKGPNATMMVDTIFETLRQVVSGYRGEWDGTYVHGATIESEGTEAEAPIDSGDYWDFVFGCDLRVTHAQPWAHVND